MLYNILWIKGSWRGLFLPKLQFNLSTIQLIPSHPTHTLLMGNKSEPQAVKKEENSRRECSKNRHSKMKRNVRRLLVIRIPANVCVGCAWIAIVVESICMSLVCIVRTCIGVVNAPTILPIASQDPLPAIYTYRSGTPFEQFRLAHI